jgi:hypothetical protein
METLQIDQYSLCTAFMQCFFGHELLGTATGFFWKAGDGTYLVSNWHVFSGRNPRTGQPTRDKTGVVPDRLTMHFHPKFDINKAAYMQFAIVDENGPLWKQHKIYGQKADLAVFNIKRILEGIPDANEFEPFCINEIPGVNDMQTSPGTDIFILGYPLGITKTGLLPVWKRGSIATEFAIDVDGLPSFLVDTATREGMSGSPVIIRSFGGYSGTTGGMTVAPGTFNQFLGVYSGRFVGEINEAHLGIIWKETLINEIIADPADGDFEILS